MSIRILSDQTIAQIAAGEVVERPASVIKELLENAVDAGADNIHIAVVGGGRKLIRISDNGSGILADEVALAFTRHATSKLRTIDDLSQIHTLGFRGEALSSIASVSRVSVSTRHRDEAMGTQMRIHGGEVTGHQPIGAPVGTVISVENLFYNTPARLKFLKKETTEKRHISALVTRYAMAYPDVRFILEQDKREIFRSSGSGQLADVVVKALGLDNFKEMIEVEIDEPAREGRPAMRVLGYTSSVEYHRADRTHITLFVNGRWVQDSTLTYAVAQAYHNLLDSGRYPVAVLMIEIPPQEVDVNVHPTKAEVRFRDANTVFAVVQRAVRQAVLTLQASDIRTQYINSNRSAFENVGTGWNGDYDLGVSQKNAPQLDLNVEDVGQYSNSATVAYGNTSDGIDPTEIPEGLGRPLKPRTLPVLRVVGQVGAMYIVAEGPAGMYLIDQHTAHERVLYEQFKELSTMPQSAVESQTVELLPADVRFAEKHLGAFKRVGYDVELFGQNTLMIRAVPEVLDVTKTGAIFRDLVAALKNEAPLDEHEAHEVLIRQVAHHGAYKSGQVLNQEQMQTLIRQLERCENPRFCPRGMPTLLHMSGEQLAREFGR